MFKILLGLKKQYNRAWKQFLLFDTLKFYSLYRLYPTILWIFNNLRLFGALKNYVKAKTMTMLTCGHRSTNNLWILIYVRQSSNRNALKRNSSYFISTHSWTIDSNTHPISNRPPKVRTTQIISKLFAFQTIEQLPS